MRVLVAYASRHGSTKGIAERIGARLTAAGLQAETVPVKQVRDVRGYDAVVLGSALYMFRWLGEASSFAHRHRRELSQKPVWLFSSGPFGPDPIDEEGRDKLSAAASGPKDLDRLSQTVAARGHRIFYGAWDRSAKPAGFVERFMALMPAAKNAMPEGDWRDWPAINAWADGIAAELAPKA